MDEGSLFQRNVMAADFKATVQATDKPKGITEFSFNGNPFLYRNDQDSELDTTSLVFIEKATDGRKYATFPVFFRKISMEEYPRRKKDLRLPTDKTSQNLMNYIFEMSSSSANNSTTPIQSRPTSFIQTIIGNNLEGKKIRNLRYKKEIQKMKSKSRFSKMKQFQLTKKKMRNVWLVRTIRALKWKQIGTKKINEIIPKQRVRKEQTRKITTRKKLKWPNLELAKIEINKFTEGTNGIRNERIDKWRNKKKITGKYSEGKERLRRDVDNLMRCNEYEEVKTPDEWKFLSVDENNYGQDTGAVGMNWRQKIRRKARSQRPAKNNLEKERTIKIHRRTRKRKVKEKKNNEIFLMIETRKKRSNFKKSFELIPALDQIHLNLSNTNYKRDEINAGKINRRSQIHEGTVKQKLKTKREMKKIHKHDRSKAEESSKRLDATGRNDALPERRWKSGKMIRPTTVSSDDFSIAEDSKSGKIRLCGKNACFNGGTCLQSKTGQACVCRAGYSDLKCDYFPVNPCLLTSCQNNGKCIVDATHRLIRCVCHEGFTGKLCQIDLNECISQPCKNGGSCSDWVNGYTCKCLVGFEGDHCETNKDDCIGKVCANGGRCIDRVNKYECKCRRGYFGRYCQKISDACLREPCFNSGECVPMDTVGYFYRCLCPVGYVGTNCEIQAAKCLYNWCRNNGTCMEAGGSIQCLCPQGYKGDLCEKERVAQCDSNRLTCHKQSQQRQCNDIHYSPVTRANDSVEDTKLCDVVEKELCLPNPCRNNGTCLAGGRSFFFCLCDMTYSGRYCQSKTMHCSLRWKNKCENGGTCLQYHQYRRKRHTMPCTRPGRCKDKMQWMKWTITRCVCPIDFTGPKCTVRNFPCTIGICSEDVESGTAEDKQLSRNLTEISYIGLEYSTTTKVGDVFLKPWKPRKGQISNAMAILFGSALIILIFGLAIASKSCNFFPCWSKREVNVYLPIPTEQPEIIADIRAQIGYNDH